MTQSTPKVAFIIPALNEEVNLRNTLTTLQRLQGHCDNVIVVDNGSTDHTLQVAAEFGAKTTVHPKVSIAQLRNAGVTHTDADILVFIDSDIQLDDSWPGEFERTKTLLQHEPLMLTGSRCRAINKHNYVGTYWYNRLGYQQSDNYINSGHLIVHRQLFERISGFDSLLRTGEDYDFCQRALNAGARLNANPNLIAWHDGYPNDVRGFMAREMWHGRGEFSTLQSFVSSKVALVAVATTLLSILAVVTSILLWTLAPLVVTVVLLLVILGGLTHKKFGKAPLLTQLHSSLLYYLYLLARSLAWKFKAGRPKARS